MARFAILIFCLSLNASLFSQSNFAGWIATFNSFKINSRFSMHLDVQARSNPQVKHLGTFIFRPGLNWHFKKNMIASLGYGLIEHRRLAGGVAGFAPEHRIWQQFIINQTLKLGILQHRLRLEERFIVKHRLDDGEFRTGGNFYATRLRYFARSVIPFKSSAPFVKGIFAAVQNELFVNLGDNSSVNGKFFDQNRVYLAMGYRLSSKFDLETGYMNQYISGNNNSFTNNHILQVATYLRL